MQYVIIGLSAEAFSHRCGKLIGKFGGDCCEAAAITAAHCLGRFFDVNGSLSRCFFIAGMTVLRPKAGQG